MCGRLIQSTGPLRYAIVEGMNVRDNRVHNYPPRWNAAPSQDLLVIRRNHQTGDVSLDRPMATEKESKTTPIRRFSAGVGVCTGPDLAFDLFSKSVWICSALSRDRADNVSNKEPQSFPALPGNETRHASH
jgi:hypothetical protein